MADATICQTYAGDLFEICRLQVELQERLKAAETWSPPAEWLSALTWLLLPVALLLGALWLLWKRPKLVGDWFRSLTDISIGGAALKLDLKRTTEEAAVRIVDVTDDLLDLALYAAPRDSDVAGKYFAPVSPGRTGEMEPITFSHAVVRVRDTRTAEMRNVAAMVNAAGVVPETAPPKPEQFLEVPISRLPELFLLWVDDRDDMVGLERRGLQRAGHNIVAVRSTEEALRLLHGPTAQSFDVVLSDAERDGNEREWSRLHGEIRSRGVRGRGTQTAIPFAVYSTADKTVGIANEFLQDGSDYDWASWAFSSYTALRWRLIWVQVRARARTLTRTRT